MTMERPGENEYHEFYKGYIDEIGDGDILELLEQQIDILHNLATSVDPAMETYRYDQGKWSVREVIGHLIDAERVFGYRAFCISRGDRSALPGFDEGTYVERAGNDRRTLASLVDELITVRRSNLYVFKNLPPGSAENLGDANGSPVSVRALAFMTAGHFRHHLEILADRYGVGGEDPA